MSQDEVAKENNHADSSTKEYEPMDSDHQDVKKRLKTSDLNLDERHNPFVNTSPRSLEKAVVTRDRVGLEETLIKIEYERQQSMIHVGDTSAFKGFIKPIGAGVVGGTIPFAIADFLPLGSFSFDSSNLLMIIVFLAGLVAAIYGHMSLSDTKWEAAIQARDYDHARVLRALERIKSDEPTTNDEDVAESGSAEPDTEDESGEEPTSEDQH